jgi:hypothetical protein
MSFLQNPFLILKKEINAGGIGYTPPTVCPLSACIPAHFPVYVECTGRTRMKKSPTIGPVSRTIEIKLNCMGSWNYEL